MAAPERDQELATARRRMRAAYLAPETALLPGLTTRARPPADAQEAIAHEARRLAERVREGQRSGSGIDALLKEYDLSTREGIALMCLAESLLRVPDAATVDRLIASYMQEGDWSRHLGHSGSPFVNAATWGLLISGHVVAEPGPAPEDARSLLRRLAARGGEPVVRGAFRVAMRYIARRFVFGETMDDALERADQEAGPLTCYSFDMLGEAARTAADVAHYFGAYQEAIAALASRPVPKDRPRDGVSIKLSALHPRYEYAQRQRVLDELVPRVTALAEQARKAELPLTIDAEESDRLELQLDVFEAVACQEAGAHEDFGLAVQAYQKRAMPLLDWLAALAARLGRRIPVRLVKGAYWDMEIKRAQEQGLDDFPVFSHKPGTDVSYLACAARLLEAPERFYPQFATHNAQTVAQVAAWGGAGPYEFQRLHGMGEALYDPADPPAEVPCRVYAPVGAYKVLLPYLVRRLLENGANVSFVNRIADDDADLTALICHPADQLSGPPGPVPRRPPELFSPDRQNARGLLLTDPDTVAGLQEALAGAYRATWQARPRLADGAGEGSPQPVTDPARSAAAGSVITASREQPAAALDSAVRAWPAWDRRPVGERAEILRAVAKRLEGDLSGLMARIIREGGRTLPDALSDVREAVDFLRYYAWRAEQDFAEMPLPAPVGERNQLSLHARGVFVSISPWNFPAAIFTGQIAAALAAGNAVIAKPAEQTPLTADAVIAAFHEAGVPPAVLQSLPGAGAEIGAALVRDSRVSGVAFTGSVPTARRIAADLAGSGGPIPVLIAETGGLNAMVVDSSALPEQVVTDVLRSAFNSAGQRCSALRVLFLQEETADTIVDMLAGAMAELRLGDPADLATDVGPVIDREALTRLQEYEAELARHGTLVYRCDPPPQPGFWFPPVAYEVAITGLPQEEVFGPILHVVRYSATKRDAVVEAINATGYGLTFGVHSRIDSTIRYFTRRVRAGNLYVNRNIVGSVVGVQPFGGEGLSGTGPKAGGPHYLPRFAVERALCVNTAAVGGDPELLGGRGGSAPD